MKIRYDSEDIHQKLIEIYKHYPKLYSLYMLVITKLKSFDFTDLYRHIEIELAKSANSKQVKYIPEEKAYEYRIPPHCKNGVLRVLFEVEEDNWTICIKKVWTKGTKPLPRKRRRR